MRFEDFAKAHGLIVDRIMVNRWVPTPTEDKPRSTNGRYKFLGDVGWVQNWATMDRPAVWFPEGRSEISIDARQQIERSNREREELAEKAASKAGWIMHQTKLGTHPYLDRKGFKDEEGNVWLKDGQPILVIPMRINKRLIGCQLIDGDGQKKFLYGQTSKGAAFTMDAGGVPIFCEGYATGLSVREIMKASNIRYQIHVCFSASNIKAVARHYGEGIVIADNDSNGTGELSAKETGKPYWISGTVGEDFNDYHMRVGKFKASQALKRVLIQTQKL